MKLDERLFNRLLLEAQKSERKRTHYNLHQSYNDPVQRMCIALQKGTYVRPHHHPQANKWELIITLKGSIGLVVFDQSGVIIQKEVLRAGDSLCGMELTPNTWHTIFPISKEAVIMEVKEGPYIPAQESDFTEWSPKEGSGEVHHFLKWVEDAKIGEKYLL